MLSRTDWQERILDGRSLMPDLPDPSPYGQRVAAVYDMLRLPDVPGQPPLSEAGGGWYREIVLAMAGAWDGERRSIREAFILVPKKSSKTSYSAAFMLALAVTGARPRGEYLMVAPTQQIAELAFSQATGMVEASPELTARCRIQHHLKIITYVPTGATLRIKSFDPKVLTGTRPVAVLIDELHVVSESHHADRVIGQLRGGLVSQPEGMLITITTQSERPPSGVFRAELLKARQVRDGTLDAPILPILYELPPGVDWRDQQFWRCVTPNDGRSVTVERLIDDYDQAVAAGEEELRRWASQHLNVEIGLALRSDRWAGADYWEPCGTATWRTLDDLIKRSEVVTLGIDGGGLDDLLALAAIGRDRETGHWLIWCRAWASAIVLDRRKGEAGRLRDYAADGDLVIAHHLGDDVDDLAAIVAHVYESGMLDQIGCDPHGLGTILEAIADAGVPSELCVSVPQGWRLTGAIKTLERRLAERSAEHPAAPMMAWAVSNCRVEPRGNAISITKQASGSAKIDPVMATLNCATLMALNPAPRGRMADFLASPIII